MIMTFTIRRDSEGFTVLTTDIIITTPGTAICTITPMILFTGEQVSILETHGVDSDLTTIITPHTTVTIFITTTILRTHMAGDITAPIITVLTTPVITTDTTMVTTMDTGVAIIMTITMELITDTELPVLQCLHMVLQGMMELQQGSQIVPLIHVTEPVDLQPVRQDRQIQEQITELPQGTYVLQMGAPVRV